MICDNCHHKGEGPAHSYGNKCLKKGCACESVDSYMINPPLSAYYGQDGEENAPKRILRRLVAILEGTSKDFKEVMLMILVAVGIILNLFVASEKISNAKNGKYIVMYKSVLGDLWVQHLYPRDNPKRIYTSPPIRRYDMRKGKIYR